MSARPMQPRLKELPVLGHGGFRRLAYAEWERVDWIGTSLGGHPEA